MKNENEETLGMSGNSTEGNDQKHIASEPISSHSKALEVLSAPPKGGWDSLNLEQKALYLAEAGFAILPIHGCTDGACSCGNPHPAQSNLTGKHPVINGWQEKATSDAASISSWLNGQDNRNYGIYCLGSTVLVMDIDPRSGGWESFDKLDQETEYSLPQTVEVMTGYSKHNGATQRGSHKYFRLPQGYSFPANLKSIGCPGIDIKVDGYVLGPGSLHKSGVNYEFKKGHAPWEIELAEIPAKVLDDIAKKRSARSGSRLGKSLIGDSEWETKWSELCAKEIENTRYADIALSNSCNEIKKMKSGEGRNNALNAKAYSLGRLIGGGQLSFSDARQRLTDAARSSYKDQWAFKQEAVELVLRQWGGGFEMGAMDPKYPQEISPEMQKFVEHISSNKPSEFIAEFVETLQMGFFDSKGGLQLVTLQKAIESMGPLALGVGKQIWRYADGVWKNDGEEEVIRRVQLLLGENSRRTHSDNILHFMKAGQVNLYGLGPSEYLNCRNGMLRLSDLNFFRHDPEFFSTVQLETNWNPDAKCPIVDNFFSEMVYDDTVNLMWEVIGVCIYLGLGPQRGIFIRGGGRNGKGTVLRLIRALIPEQYVSTVEVQKLATDTFAAAELFGKILNVVGDLSPKAMADTAIFKMLTGEDSINAQRKYGQPFSFTSQATLLFAANELPQSTDDTEGFFSRMLIIPMDKRTLSREEIDRTLEPRMHEELQGVLAKAVLGLKRVLDRGGYEIVERCQQELEQYMNPVDTIELFSNSIVSFTGSKSDHVKRTELYEKYEFFCITNELAALPKTLFYRDFTKKNAGRTIQQKTGGYQVFQKLKLNESGYSQF